MSPSELKVDFESMARERAGGVVSLQLAWSAVLNKLTTLELEESYVRAVVNGCLAPRDVELITTLLSTSSKVEAVFDDALTSSAYSLDELIAGVIALCRYLDRDRRQTTLEMVVGYVRCCEDGASAYPSAESFQEVVELMLEEHGFSGVN